jgi:hypothetical protein
VLPLRDNPFEAEFAGAPKTVAFHVLIESNVSLGQDHLKRRLAALQWITPQVVAVQLDQVEGIQQYAFAMTAVANEIERSDPVVITGDCLAVNDAGARAQAYQCFDDQRKAVGEIIARAAVEAHLLRAMTQNHRA